MRVAVTSKNPVKLEAVKRAFQEYFPKKPIDFITISVNSDVREQPMSADETAKGAYNRTTNVKNAAVDFVVGIEGGLCFITLNGQEHAFEQTWACVLDCKTGQSELGSGPAYPVPPNVIRQIHSGKNLSEAMAEEYGTEELGKNDGYNGWLSGNKIDRTEASRIPVFLALCGLMKEEYQNGKK